MSRQFILLEPEKKRLDVFSRLDAWVCHKPQDILDVVPRSPKSAIWISFSPKSNDDFLKAMTGKGLSPFRGRLLALKPPRPENLPLLTGCFQQIFGIGPSFRFLPDEELVEVLKQDAEDARDFFIGGTVDLKHKAVGLIRGDVSLVVVPLSLFVPNQKTKPDQRRLAFTDYGQTVCLGEYEASADSILYDFDPEYRRKVNARRRAEDKTFGACLRRVRQAKMLTRQDFPPLSEKEIARIERSEVGKPHAKSMKVICDRLGMKPEEIESW